MADVQELLAKARQALEADDLLQASEKGWGAAAHAVKQVGAKRRWGHRNHRQLFGVINRLAHETGDTEIRTLFNVASALHTNFYEEWMPKESVEDGLVRVETLVRKLEVLA